MEYLHKNKILYRDLKVVFCISLAWEYFGGYSGTFEDNGFWDEQVWVWGGKQCLLVLWQRTVHGARTHVAQKLQLFSRFLQYRRDFVWTADQLPSILWSRGRLKTLTNETNGLGLIFRRIPSPKATPYAFTKPRPLDETLQFPRNQEQPLALRYWLEIGLGQTTDVEICARYLQDLYWLGVFRTPVRSWKDEWLWRLRLPTYFWWLVQFYQAHQLACPSWNEAVYG